MEWFLCLKLRENLKNKKVFSLNWSDFCCLSYYCNAMVNNNKSVRSKFMRVHTAQSLKSVHLHSLEGTLILTIKA